MGLALPPAVPYGRRHVSQGNRVMNYFYLLSIVLLFANDSFAQDNHVHNPVITPETAPAANATAHEHSITVVAELENTAAMPMDHSAIAMRVRVIPTLTLQGLLRRQAHTHCRPRNV